MRVFLKTSTALLLALLAALGLFELFLRVAGPLHGQAIQGHKILLPTNRVYVYDNIRVRGADEHIVVTKNSIGFRGPNPPPDFNQWLTIVAVGGSATECFYLSDGHDWPARLSARLAPDFKNLWIDNAGIDGHSTFGNLLLFEDYLPQLKPKMAILLTGANDIGLKDPNKDDDKVIRGGPGGRLRTLAREIQNRSRAIGFLQFAYRTLTAKHRSIRHSDFDLTKVPTLDVSEAQFDAVRKEHEKLYLPAFQSRLETIVALSQGSGIEPILLTHPALYGEGVDNVTGVSLARMEAENHLNGKMAWRLLELYNDRIRQIAHHHHLLLIDLAREMPKSSRYFCDFYHLSNEGSAKVAEILAKNVEPYLRAHYPDFVIQNTRRNS